MFLAAALYSSPPEGLRLRCLSGEPTLPSISSQLLYIQVTHINHLSNTAALHMELLTRQRGRLAPLPQPTLPACTWHSARVARPPKCFARTSTLLADTGVEMLIILIMSSAFPPSLGKINEQSGITQGRLQRLLTRGQRDTPGPRNSPPGKGPGCRRGNGHPALQH